MISSSHLNKLIHFIFFLYILIFIQTLCVAAVDIWEKQENKSEQSNQINDEKEITIETPSLSEDVNKIVIKIDENGIEESQQTVIGIFDPEENNFNLNMWVKTDGEDIKKVLNRINKLKLSKLSEDLLFQILFTNSYPPQKN